MRRVPAACGRLVSMMGPRGVEREEEGGGGGVTNLFAWPAGEGALELEEGTADLVTQRGVALLVLHAVGEEAATAGGGGGGGVVVVVMRVMHVGG